HVADATATIAPWLRRTRGPSDHHRAEYPIALALLVAPPRSALTTTAAQRRAGDLRTIATSFGHEPATLDLDDHEIIELLDDLVHDLVCRVISKTASAILYYLALPDGTRRGPCLDWDTANSDRRGLDGAVIVEVEASDDNEDLLDLAGQDAAEINNRGVAAQIDYLLGPSPA
ncbi:MAG: hypothetical protein GY925_14680, partial [Actinomycetia bacterium]|nr:hypothetical protein [Actinomycetes bacterium]